MSNRYPNNIQSAIAQASRVQSAIAQASHGLNLKYRRLTRVRNVCERSICERVRPIAGSCICLDDSGTWLATVLVQHVTPPPNISFKDMMNMLKHTVSVTTMRTNCAPTESIQSGIVGWIDTWAGTQRRKLIQQGAVPIPPIRYSMMDIRYPHITKHIYHLMKQADKMFKQVYPTQYTWQRAMVRNSGFSLHNTAFTTVTINVNTHLLVHRDGNNLKGGVCAIVTLGTWTGGYLSLPEYETGFKLRQGDIILFDNSRLHCTTPIKSGERVSLVFYARNGVVRKGSRTSPTTVKTYVRKWLGYDTS